MQNIHYALCAVAALCGFFAHYLVIREEPNKIQHEVVDKALKAINQKLDSIIDKISEQKVELGVMRSEIENLKDRVTKLEDWFGELIATAKHNINSDM